MESKQKVSYEDKAAWKEVVAEKSASDPLFAKIQKSYQAFRDDYSIWAKNAYLN